MCLLKSEEEIEAFKIQIIAEFEEMQAKSDYKEFLEYKGNNAIVEVVKKSLKVYQYELYLGIPGTSIKTIILYNSKTKVLYVLVTQIKNPTEIEVLGGGEALLDKMKWNPTEQKFKLKCKDLFEKEALHRLKKYKHLIIDDEQYVRVQKYSIN